MCREKFEEAFLKENPEILDMSFDLTTNKYLLKEVQCAWWAWQEQQKPIDELLESKRDYVCDCGFLDLDVEELDHVEEIDEKAQKQIKAELCKLIDRVNQYGLNELFEELDRVGFSVGKVVNRKDVMKAHLTE